MAEEIKIPQEEQKQNGVSNVFQAINKNIGVGFDKAMTKFMYPTNRLAEALGVNPEVDVMLKKEKQLKNDIKSEEDKLQQYYSSKDVVTGSTLNVMGSLVQGVSDPFNIAINSATGGMSIGAQAILNAADYLAEEKIVYDRNVTDITTEDLPGLLAGIVMPKGAEFINSKKFKGGEALFDIGKVDAQGRLYEKMTPNDIVEDLNSKGLDVQDTGKVMQDIKDVTSIIKNIDETTDITDKLVLTQYLSDEYGEFGNWVKNNNIGLVEEGYTYKPRQSSLDIVNQSLNMSQEQMIIPKNQMADVISKNKFDGVQGEYGFSRGIESNFETFLGTVRKLDKAIETELAQKNRTTIRMERELDINFKPIVTELEFSLKQLEVEDARELFGKTKNSKPFGNQLYDFAKSWDKEEFINILQGDVKEYYNEAKLRADELRKAGKIDEADSIMEKAETFSILKNKLNYFVGVSAGEESALDIDKAFYINTFYNKREYMQNLNTAVKNNDQEFFNNISNFVGGKVKVSDDDVKSIRNSMKVLGEESRITSGGEYSMKEFGKELSILLRNDIESTTKAAEKGAYGKPKEISEIGKKWGNDGEYKNFAQSFTGVENEPYEVISNIYSTVAKSKLGLDKIDGYIRDLTPGMKLKEEPTNKFLQTLTDRPIGKNIKAQLEGLGVGGMVERRYKPNFNLNPDDSKLKNKMIAKGVKNFMTFKFLTSLNGVKEEGMNKRLGVRGASQLGWDLKYNQLKDGFFKPIELENGFLKTINGIRKENLDGIKDPILRARAESFLTKYLANDPIFNDPTKWHLKEYGRESKALKYADKTMETLHNVSKKGAWLQTASDAHRTFNAEWLSKNYVQDIIPTLNKNSTPLLKQILDSNGIDDIRFNEIKNKISSMGSDAIDELVFSGKIAKNDDEHVIQQLFEQFADVLGRKFDPFESAKAGMFGNDFITDQWALFKRFSMGALSRTWNSLSNYYGSDGHLRSRMGGVMEVMRSGEGLKGYKNVFEGANRMCLGNFAWTAAKFTLATSGIQYITGKASGTSQDERVMAKIDALSRGEVIPTILDSALDQFYNETGANIVFGSKSVLGSFADTTIRRIKLASSSENLSPTEKIGYFLATAFSPEILSRGIDNVKFKGNIGTRAYGFGEKEQQLWKSKYRREAEYEQKKGELPIEKVGAFLLGGAISLFSLGSDANYDKVDDKGGYDAVLSKDPKLAHKIMGTDKSMVDDKTAVIGASGVLEMAEEATELQAITEILTDKDLLPEQKEIELFNLGLDVDTQARRMRKTDFNTLSAVMAFKQIRDPQQILTVMHQFNASKNKNDFFNEMFKDDTEYDMFSEYFERVLENKKEINEKIKKRKTKIGTEGYREILEILNSY